MVGFGFSFLFPFLNIGFEKGAWCPQLIVRIWGPSLPPKQGLCNPPANFLQTSAWKISRILILGWNELHEA